jgi:hypothetical protein
VICPLAAASPISPLFLKEDMNLLSRFIRRKTPRPDCLSATQSNRQNDPPPCPYGLLGILGPKKANRLDKHVFLDRLPFSAEKARPKRGSFLCLLSSPAFLQQVLKTRKYARTIYLANFFQYLNFIVAQTRDILYNMV